ncbi:hypothetical protein F4808DRAFT_75823 [Astrocystis sublimbata]|nr:hypothetical protein F4808DRAFT_75823 [Astrocystis sublimbata]
MPGGVCAVLDYETDIMSEYVADMATRIVLPHASATAAFRKFVNQILTSTRLPSTTILLGMNYLAKHMNMHKRVGTYDNVSEGEVWKMLTVGLLLGSKFLDDNTFQNRSWSDVSGIAVAELNVMEARWLRDMDWNLYVNLDRSHDYNAWLDNWKQYQDSKQQVIQQQQTYVAPREKLAPIVTSITHEVADQERMKASTRYGQHTKMTYRPREGSWPNRHQNPWTQAPLTPPDSGYGTPEYLSSAASANAHYNEYFSQAVQNQNYGRYYQPPASHHYSSSRSCSQFHRSYMNFHFGHGSWNAAVAECNCAMCEPMTPMHYLPHGYGQAVML